MKSYHDIVGDGGSRILEQVAEQRARILEDLRADQPSFSSRWNR